MGINYKEAKSLTEFFHFRKPESAQAAAVLKSVDLTTTTDFLDSISKDDPKGKKTIYIYNKH